MKTLPSLSKIIAGSILLHSGQIDCVCLMNLPFETSLWSSREISAI